MRITHYHPRAATGDGGITNSVRQLSRALGHLGQDPVIVHDGGEPPPGDSVEWRAVRHVGRGAGRVPVGIGAAIADADLLVLNSAWTGHNAAAAAAARRLGVPYVLAPRGAYDPRILRRRRALKATWWWASERRTVAGAAAVHVFFAAQEAPLRTLGYRGPLIVAPNGVDAPQRRWDGGSGGYVLYLGRFDPEHKGLDLLVRAVASMPAAQRPSVRLHGPDWRGGKARVRALVSRLQLDDVVRVGRPLYEGEKWEAITRATGFAYPSRWEGFGSAAAEAAAVGVPLLVTGYPLGVHLAERDGAVLAPATVAGLADGLRRLSAPGAAGLGRRAAEIVASELTWAAVARRWLQQAVTLRSAVSG